MPICYVKPIIDESVRQLCCKPYPNHPKGCPNYGKRMICPPQVPMLQQVFNLDRPILAVWCSFSLVMHRGRMREKHPSWSRLQLDCCLYWQGKVKSRLRKNIDYSLLYRRKLFDDKGGLIVVYVPEAMGVNVTETMKNIGVILEWPPVNRVIKVAFLGTPVVKNELTDKLKIKGKRKGLFDA